ncbi:MAG: PorV/PorQ family protein [Spirochaetes bacterium]|nr:PorV/PorQ family protein [Spirochaetota bacterium]
MGNEVIKRIAFFTLITVILISSAFTRPLLLMDSFSARNFSLAQSDITMKGDLDSISVNPAGLAQVKGLTAGLYYLSWFEEMRCYSITAGTPIHIKKRSYGTLALNISAFSVKPFPNYDENGDQLADLNVHDNLITIGYGLTIFKDLEMGLSFKYFQTELDKDHSDDFAFDVGLLDHFRLPLIGSIDPSGNFSIGISLQNFSFLRKYSEGNNALPQKIRAGICYLFYNKERMDIAIMLSVNHTKDLKTGLDSGLELSFWDLLKTRLGYKIVTDSSIFFTCGAGLLYTTEKYEFILDYALIPLKDLGTHHAFSFKIIL